MIRLVEGKQVWTVSAYISKSTKLPEVTASYSGAVKRDYGNSYDTTFNSCLDYKDTFDPDHDYSKDISNNKPLVFTPSKYLYCSEEQIPAAKAAAIKVLENALDFDIEELEQLITRVKKQRAKTADLDTLKLISMDEAERICHQWAEKYGEVVETKQAITNQSVHYHCKSGRTIYFGREYNCQLLHVVYHKSAEEHPEGEGGIIAQEKYDRDLKVASDEYKLYLSPVA